MMIIAITVIVTAFLVVVGLNFAPRERQIQRKIKHEYGVLDEQFKRDMSHLLGPTILDGNTVKDLQNGHEIFPAMLHEIHRAQKTITFETYIYWSGTVGRQFAEALAERAKAGVKVHVLLDWAGSQKMEQELSDIMVAAGVEIEKYHPLAWYNISRMNNRTHRKLLIVDGRVGFTGGVGIADEWDGNAESPDHWRDVHFRVEGPVVAQMQGVFIDNWMKTTGHVLQGRNYFPPLEAVGNIPGQMFSSSPSAGSESMQLMYLLAIAAAEKKLDIEAAYFVTDQLTQNTLIDAAKRGVRIRIIVPGHHIDAKMVRHASRAQWGALFEAGIEIYEFQKTMMHSKVFIADEYIVSVGSTNFDNRSFELNDEANLNLYDTDFGRRMSEMFEEDLKRSRRITVEEWKKRPWKERILEHVTWPFTSQM